MPPRTHLTRQEAAEYTGFSQDTLAKWAVTRKGPKFTKFGMGRSARVRYAIVDLDAFLSGKQSTSQGGATV
jgi:excisionase family DNA binding protein